jgi:hypothetical protein
VETASLALFKFEIISAKSSRDRHEATSDPLAINAAGRMRAVAANDWQ